VTAAEAYELTTRGGASDFARLIADCELFGPYCLIGGLAVNCYVEPVYTLDADIVVAHPHSLNALTSGSQLRFSSPRTSDTSRFQPVPWRPMFWACA
jgi:hypothetical protein